MTANKDDYRVGRHVVFDLSAHVVLVTKYRKGAITDRVRADLVETAREVCGRFEAELLEADGETDHLHLLIQYPPKVSLSKLVGAIKTNTSRLIRAQDYPEVQRALWGEHFWSPSYMVLSTGGAGIETIRDYIQNQRNPNRKAGRPKTR